MAQKYDNPDNWSELCKTPESAYQYLMDYGCDQRGDADEYVSWGVIWVTEGGYRVCDGVNCNGGGILRPEQLPEGAHFIEVTFNEAGEVVSVNDAFIPPSMED